MLAFLGWNPGTPQEIFSIDDLCETFTLDRVGKSGAKFDFDKTKWFNQQYLRSKSKLELAEMLQVILKKNDISAELNYVANVCQQLKERATFIKDMWSEGKYYFQPPKSYDDKVIRKKCDNDIKDVLNELKIELTELVDFSAENIETVFKLFLEKKKIKMGVLLPVLRVSLTGLAMGPSLFNIAELIGKKETLFRIDTAIKKITK